ncbi:MAG: 50S ribosomal protein L21 [Gaiellaceae bacterium]
MSYAVIAVGGKQYLVHEGERLLVDRLPQGEGERFKPHVLLASADGKPAPSSEKVAVNARVVSHTLGEKIRIGKLRRRTGYRRHTGFRAKLSQIEIESISSAAASARKAPAAKAEAAPVAAPTPARAAAPRQAAKSGAKAEVAKPKATATKAPARKPAAKPKAPAEKPAAAPKRASKPRTKKED